MAATVYVLPKVPGKGVPTGVRRAIDARIPVEAVWRKEQWTQGVPDFYVAGSSAMTELRQAARMGIIYVIFLPESGEWFAQKVWERIEAGHDVFIYQRQQAGGDYPWS